MIMKFCSAYAPPLTIAVLSTGSTCCVTVCVRAAACMLCILDAVGEGKGMWEGIVGMTGRERTGEGTRMCKGSAVELKKTIDINYQTIQLATINKNMVGNKLTIH